MRNSGVISRMPPHPQQQLDWKGNPNLLLAPHDGNDFSFNYIAPTTGWTEAALANTSPTYRSGEAYAIGNQPYDSTELMVAARTPRVPNINTNYKGYRGVQSSSSVYNSQVLMGQLLKGKS